MEEINDIKDAISSVALAIAMKERNIDVLMKEKVALQQQKSALETRLADRINAPTSDGADLTHKLPDELMIQKIIHG